MVTWKTRIAQLEQRIDATMERLIFRHKVLGFLVVFVGMPLVTLVAVCACTTAIVFPLAMVLGWD